MTFFVSPEAAVTLSGNTIALADISNGDEVRIEYSKTRNGDDRFVAVKIEDMNPNTENMEKDN